MANNVNIKNNIKASALELFNTAGYESTSIRDLSAKAKCSLPMMYYYYESKEKLLQEIVTVDFFDIINDVFAQAIKAPGLKAFVTSFISGIANLTVDKKNTLRIALRLHMGSPKNDALNKTILSFKYAKELELKNMLLAIWRADKNIEAKTHLLMTVIYNAMVCILLTNRQISIKQIENDIQFLLN